MDQETDYTAVDRNAMMEELSSMADIIRDSDISDEKVREIDANLSEINNLLHDFTAPIGIRDDRGGFVIRVNTE